MLRVFIDARTVRPGMTGVGRATLALVRALGDLARTGADNAPPLALRAGILPASLEAMPHELEHPAVEWTPIDFDYESHPRGDLALRFRMSRFVREGELYHGPAFLVPGGRQPFARVVTIHDMSVFRRPQDHSRPFAFYLRRCIRRSAKLAHRIIVPTRAVADELKAELGTPEERIRVVHEAPIPDALDAGAPANVPADPRLPDAPFFVSMGTIEPRKDPLTALRALELLNGREGSGAPARDAAPASPPANWLWLGAPGFRGEELLRAIRDSPSAGRFRCPGAADAALGRAALARAVALVYPSLHEGFGLPPLEAMAAGAPAVVADIAPLREVCGDAALYFPPGDARALAERLGRLLADDALRADLVRRGAERARHFTWERAARATLDVYRECAG